MKGMDFGQLFEKVRDLRNNPKSANEALPPEHILLRPVENKLGESPRQERPNEGNRGYRRP